MPRGFAPAAGRRWRGRGSRRTCARATTGPGAPTSWPRERSADSTAASTRSSTTSTPGLHLPRVEGARKAGGVEHRGVDRLLQRHATHDVPQEEQRLPLVLLVTAGSPAREHRLATSQHAAWGTAWCAVALRAPGTRAVPGPARTSATGCPGTARARGSSASSAASHRSASPRSCCPSGRRRRRGRCRPSSLRRAGRSARPSSRPSSRPSRARCSPASRRRTCSARRGSRPPGDPGRSSTLADGPTRPARVPT